MAYVANEREACPGCGEPLDVSTDPESEGRYTAEAVRCHACAAQSKADRGIDEKAGLLVHFTRRPTPEA